MHLTYAMFHLAEKCGDDRDTCSFPSQIIKSVLWTCGPLPVIDVQKSKLYWYLSPANKKQNKSNYTAQ